MRSRVAAVCSSLVLSALLLSALPSTAHARHYHTLKYPVILLHGFNASPFGKTGFTRQVHEALMRGTVNVVAPQLNPFAGTRERGRHVVRIIEQVKRAYGVSKVHLIGHSQGGLDARWAASPNGGNMGDSVASIVSVSTPHRGTPMADMALKLLGGRGKVRSLLRNVACRLMALRLDRSARTNFKWDAQAALRDMSTKQGISPRLPDHHGVKYYSVGAESVVWRGRADAKKGRTGALLWAVVPTVASGRSDGTVPTESAKWGTYLGTLPADHYAVVGQGRNGGRDTKTGFTPTKFYAHQLLPALHQAEHAAVKLPAVVTPAR